MKNILKKYFFQEMHISKLNDILTFILYAAVSLQPPKDESTFFRRLSIMF